MFFQRSVLLFVLGLALLISTPTWAQFYGLTGRIPSDANAIILLDADKIMASPLARRENWSQQRANRVDAGLTILPESTKKLQTSMAA